MTLDLSARVAHVTRALTVHQPWASLLAAGDKPWECRTWNPAWYGDVLIHAGKTRVPVGLGDELRAVMAVNPSAVLNGDEPLRSFVGIAHLVDVHPASPSCTSCLTWCEPTGWHWRFTHAQMFPQPVPWLRGLTRLWRVSPATTSLVVASLKGGNPDA